MTPPKQKPPRKKYALLISLSDAELRTVEELERMTSLPRTHLFRWLLAEEANRRVLHANKPRGKNS